MRKIFVTFAVASLSLIGWSGPLYAADCPGTVVAITGVVQVTGQSQKALKRGSKVCVGDAISSKVNGRAQIRMDGGELYTLNNDSTFKISQYQQGGADNAAQVLVLSKGTLFALSGLGKAKRLVKTPAAETESKGTASENTIKADGREFGQALQGILSLVTIIFEKALLNAAFPENKVVISSKGNIDVRLDTPAEFTRVLTSGELKAIETETKKMAQAMEEFVRKSGLDALSKMAALANTMLATSQTLAITDPGPGQPKPPTTAEVIKGAAEAILEVAKDASPRK